MKRRGIKRQKVQITVLIIILTAALILLIAIIVPEPPAEEFKMYHNLIDNRGIQYENKTLIYADFFREKAYEEWHKQNAKFIINRDYSDSKRMILMAISFVQEANNTMSTNNSDNYKIHNDIDNNHLDHFEQRVSENGPLWEQWVSEALSYSKQKGSVVIIIDKLNHRCLVIDKGRPVKDYLIEMGINYFQDKHRNGDFATPEGIYYITNKKTNLNYKSLFLNYPNKEDNIRFVKNADTGQISGQEAVTDKISIHGHGGKGYDWTNGSIALSNDKMDSLFKLVKIGTRVVIVGKANYDIPQKEIE